MKIRFFSWLYLITVCSLFANFGIFVVSDQCLHDQRDLLIGLKSSLKFHSTLSTKLVHWNESLNCCLWKGVTCSEEGRVIGLNLFNESISGSLHNSSLFSLQYLENLNLAYNKLSSSLIPPQFGNLTNLIYLNLSNAGFKGQIPIEISNLSRLVTLDLSAYYLSDSMLKIKTPNLAMLVQNFGELKELYLDGVNISAPGNEWCQALSSSVPNLRVLSMSDCYLSQLTFLDLSYNKIPGVIPNWIQNLTNLLYLDLSHNLLEGPLLNLPSMLTILDLHSNQLQGQLPTLPPSAVYLDLSRNNFTSFIPAGILSSLSVASLLYLSDNQLSGSIPVSICTAPYLQVLDLSNNFLNGTIPQCFYVKSETLMVLDLRRNKLGGNLSDSFPVNCGLQTLNLNGNLLEGVVPKSLRNCKNLEVLDMGNNQLKDAFPCKLTNISSLHVLILRSNKFFGSIDCGGPNTSWPMLQIVDLASNNFTGQLPRESLSAWKAMMNAAQPEYEPPQFVFPSLNPFYYQHVITVTSKGLDIELVKIRTIFTTTIDISNNSLDGPIPEELGELKSLRILNISHNVLTGHIPPFLGNLTQLESLDLSSNRLTGEIPAQLTDITFLSFLSLSFNQLVGPIPQGKQFSTFTNDSYEGNEGLCGIPLNKYCALVPRSPPPTFQETHSNSKEIHLNFLSAELGFIFGFGMVIWPLMFWKRWSRWYFTHVDDILIRIFPQLNLGIKYRQRRARIYQGRRH